MRAPAFWMRALRAGGAIAACVTAAACAPGSGEPATAGPDGAAPLAEAACRGCHSSHWSEWSTSRHAAAADDPLFVAMNARGQRETNGQLGVFCVRCHAPLAVARGLTTDGSNLSALPADVKGVTCTVCHTAHVDGSTLSVADDGVMRGPLADAAPSAGHASLYSAALDRDQPESADFCGTCHAVTNDHGLEVERTVDEWRTTAYATAGDLRTCGHCHMPETTGTASDIPGAPTRSVHAHDMPGVDLGNTSDADVQHVEAALDPAISSRLCVVPSSSSTEISVLVENALVGHAWPSGATQNRRAWLELEAFAGGQLVYSSGVVDDSQPLAAAAAATPDPPLVLLREQLYDATGAPTPFMWNAFGASADLLAPYSADPAGSQRSVSVTVAGAVDRVTSQVLVRAVDRDVTGALIASGDLTPAAAGLSPTLSVRATALEWTADRGAACLP